MRISNHGISHIFWESCYNLKHLRRHTCLTKNICKQKGCQRSLFSRFAYHTIVGGDAWSNFMCNHVERMIERRYRANHPLQRLSLSENLALLPVGCEIAGKYLAIIQNAKLPCKTENIEGSTNFIQ